MTENTTESTGEKGLSSSPLSTDGLMRWYVVHAYAGMEKSVQRALAERIDRSGMQTKFGRILVPSEEVVEVKNGQRVVTERRLFPGYVFVEMEMTDETWHLVKNTNKVSGFIGGKANKPTPIPFEDVQKIIAQVEGGGEKPRPKVLYEVGEVIRIKDGPFTDFNGNVEEVHYEKSKVRVTVTIFGRATPVDLDFSQIEKV